MPNITIMDPVTRIEGHMKVDVTIDYNQVVDAKCTGTLFRGFETLLKGRDPWDAPVITQRICGVCPISHSMASVIALDKALGKQTPDNARILRNLTLGANFIQSHILHFYLLSAVDYMQGPETAPWVPAWDVDIRIPNTDPLLGNFVKAVEARRRAHEMGAVFSGRMPAPGTFIPGGYTSNISSDMITKFRNHLNWLIDFISYVYIPDVEALGTVYPEYYNIGKGYGNLLAYGVFDLDNTGETKLLKRGYVRGTKPSNTYYLDLAKISEKVAFSWYDDADNGKHPYFGDTRPVYPKDSAYSWLKAPRYNNVPFEVGPLARMYVNGDYKRGVSVMDRHKARALETLKVAEAMNLWLNQLTVGAVTYDNTTMNASGGGVGLTEAPRGALGHWVKIVNSKISHYQIITPTCWNASPMDENGNNGPMEKALIGTPVQDPSRPIEVLRVIHSFDPCLSCAVHIMQPDKKPVVIHTGAGQAQC